MFELNQKWKNRLFRFRTWLSFNYGLTYELVYSRDEELYYVNSISFLPGAGCWMHVDETNTDVLPFVFWKVKTKRNEKTGQTEYKKVGRSHPLVLRYKELILSEGKK